MSGLQAAGRALPLNKPRAGQLLLVALGILALDQLTKSIVVSQMFEGQSIPVVDGILHWTFVRNPGAAFSLFTELPWLFTILATAISTWIIATANRPKDRINMLAFGAVLGGAVGNLVDRVVREPKLFQGHVVDFIDVRVWPTFNVADSAVVVGAITLVVASWLEERRNASNDQPERADSHE